MTVQYLWVCVCAQLSLHYDRVQRWQRGEQTERKTLFSKWIEKQRQTQFKGLSVSSFLSLLVGGLSWPYCRVFCFVFFCHWDSQRSPANQTVCLVQQCDICNLWFSVGKIFYNFLWYAMETIAADSADVWEDMWKRMTEVKCTDSNPW